MVELINDCKKVDKRKMIPVVTQNIYIPFISNNDFVVREVQIGIEFSCQTKRFKYWMFDEVNKEKVYIEQKNYVKNLNFYSECFKDSFYNNKNDVNLNDVIMIGLGK